MSTNETDFDDGATVHAFLAEKGPIKLQGPDVKPIVVKQVGEPIAGAPIVAKCSFKPAPAISAEDLAAWRAAMRALPPEPHTPKPGTRPFERFGYGHGAAKAAETRE